MGDLLKGFFDKYFQREKREARVEKFINLLQGGISIKEYYLKCIKLSIYASSLVSNDRDEMSYYVTCVLKELKEECHTIMIHDNIFLSRLMVHSQPVKDSHLRNRKREAKKAKSFEVVIL